MSNIRDVAEKCKVNIATVSRAINGKKGVSEKMRARILDVAIELGYSKDSLAAGLISRRTGIVGLVVPDISNPYYASVAQGVSAELREHGYASFLCDSRCSHEQELQFFGMLCSYRVEGAVIISQTATDGDLDLLLSQGVRVVCADSQISRRVTAVVNDDYQGACAMAEHLVLDCGIRSITAVMDDRYSAASDDRMRGLGDTLERLGCPDVLSRVEHVAPYYQSALEAAPALVKSGSECLFCFNDNVALGILNYCSTHGIEVPRDIKISGFDDIPEASMAEVPLTTVHQHKYVLGRKAAAQLIAEIDDPEAQPMRIALVPKLAARLSCGEKPLF
jgi:LacI family transcriptional regulator